MLIKHGATVKKVQRLLGHAKPSITGDLYVHLWEDDEDDTADIPDGVLSAFRVRSVPGCWPDPSLVRDEVCA